MPRKGKILIIVTLIVSLVILWAMLWAVGATSWDCLASPGGV